MFYKKRFARKSCSTTKRFEYSTLGSELKKQTDIANKQYLGLGKVYQLDKKESDETINIKMIKKTALKKYNNSNLIYKSNHSF